MVSLSNDLTRSTDHVTPGHPGQHIKSQSLGAIFSFSAEEGTELPETGTRPTFFADSFL